MMNGTWRNRSRKTMWCCGCDVPACRRSAGCRRAVSNRTASRVLPTAWGNASHHTLPEGRPPHTVPHLGAAQQFMRADRLRWPLNATVGRLTLCL